MDEFRVSRFARSSLLRAIEGQRYSTTPEITTAEDLIESRGVLAFDENRREWGIAVIGSTGVPRKHLGTCILRATEDGALVASIEGMNGTDYHA